MTPLKFTVPLMMIRLCVGTIESSQKNISCSDIKTAQGFQFSHECPAGAHVFAYYNKTTIATVTNGEPAFMRGLVKSVDTSSITTVECRDLRVKCQISDDEVVKEKLVNFTVASPPEELKNHEPDSPTPYGLWIGVGTGVVALIIMGILVGFCCRYCCWRNDMMEQHQAATVLGFLSDLPTACCRKRKSHAEPTELGYVVTAASDPQGSGENCPVQNGASVAQVHSGDTNGHVSRAIKRVKNDDPGGCNCVMVTDACSGCVRGDRGAEDHETESSLLPNERANIQDLDMAGEAEAFVNNRGFDPGQVSRCFAAPNFDVESPSQDEETQYT